MALTIDDVKGLLATGKENVMPESWKISYTIKDKNKMSDVDTVVDNIVVEPIIIDVNDSECDSCSSSNKHSSYDN